MEQKFKEKNFFMYKFLNDCLPIYSLYAILFKEKGLSLTEISLLLSFWSFIALISEVPSGILADRWNRKHMLYLATALKAACYMIWCFSNGFIMFAAGFLFWGISGAFRSGTEEGLIYDNLKSEGREDAFIKIYGKGRFYESMGNVIGITSGGVLAYFLKINIISVISAGILIVNIFFISGLREKNYYSDKLKNKRVGYFKTLFEAAKLCAKNQEVLLGLALLVFITGVISFSDEYDSLIINDFRLAYIWISVIYGARFTFIALGNHFAGAIKEKIKSKNNLFILSFAASLFLLLFSVIWNKYGIIALGLGCMIMTAAEVIQINFIQDE
ncbi:MAG: MFS transporter, partial [Oscillospiraceae bacterium]|nr:MFS transporter [Oscillospiraceae bacterium]